MNGRGQRDAELQDISLYVHIPFCAKKCHYCSFYSVRGSASDYDAFLRALAIEWRMTRDEEGLDDGYTQIVSIYVGGGTPSLLGAARLNTVLELLREGPAWEQECEVSIEVNPENADRDLIEGALQAGCNRISVGVQSFNDEDLRLLGRLSDAERARQALHEVRQAGCRNMNMDLIYGLSSQNLETWVDTLKEAISFNTEHLLCRLLSSEEDTVQEQLLRGRVIESPLDELLLQQYEATREAALAAGLEHYEISSFARPGFRCRHNERGRKRAPYYGLGPAAHSFDGQARWCNAADLPGYMDQLTECARRPRRQRYRLAAVDEIKELILLGLRRAEGLTWARVDEAAAPDAATRLAHRAEFLAATGFLEVDDKGLRLSPRAYFVSNTISLELIRALEGSG